MKNITTIAIFLLLSISATAQCDKLIISTYDKMTGRTTLSSDYIVLSKNKVDGVALMFIKGQQSTILSAQIFGPSSCVDDKATMNILFTDGSRLELTNDGKFNCDRKWSKFFFNAEKSSELKQLSEKTIEAIRVHTFKGSVTEDVPLEKANEIRETLNCITQGQSKQ
jgi:hypothetical protein